jgi:hypothetical protein
LKKLTAGYRKWPTHQPDIAKGIKNYLIDIDGTVCDDIPNEEPERCSLLQFIPMP